ncbi:hypothetical protein MicloDRAFT_00003070 [Microvirga lotononidis]|uniref:Uncharacterized protein n=1 Tax=Microvirga lotononidis TaxID=864069 RepID=I4Z3I8_9HYPH|nr:hypothetical protein MicloDRAFT_00003070 [Microvirga lotononidis]
MAKTSPRPDDNPDDTSLIQVSWELVKHSRELLAATKPLVERRQHWPVVRDQGQKSDHAQCLERT